MLYHISIYFRVIVHWASHSFLTPIRHFSFINNSLPNNSFITFLLPDTTTINSLTPQSATLQYPNPISFTCQAQTDIATPLTYTWLLNNQPITNGLVNVSSTQGTVYIDIQNDASKGTEFLGMWSCVASNGISTAVANATLNRVPGMSGFWSLECL